MNLSERDIEWIVGEVVRRVQNLDGRRAADRVTPGAALGQRVITLESLKGQLDSVRQITVLPQAIITPAARDELQRRGVKVVRNLQARAEATAQSTGPLAANAASGVCPRLLARLVGGFGAKLVDRPAGELAAVIAEQSEQAVRESRQAVWFTSQPAHAVCLANRHPGIWAVEGHSEESLRAALASVAANVLVIDPNRKSQYVLRRMLEAFVRK